MTDAVSDILGEALHAGFRLGDRIAQDMVAVRLTPPLRLAVLGSPDYLARRGWPVAPSDLLGHDCIRYRFQTSGDIYPWRFRGAEGAFTVDVRGGLVATTLPAVIDMTARGLGLAYTFRDFAAPQLASGAFVPLLEDAAEEVPGVYLYFPREYRSMVPLRLFLDHLKARRRAPADADAAGRRPPRA